jgi:hypothetical protein
LASADSLLPPTPPNDDDGKSHLFRHTNISCSKSFNSTITIYFTQLAAAAAAGAEKAEKATRHMYIYV